MVFNDAKFRGFAYFVHAKFDGLATFLDVDFDREADFSYAKLGDEVIFLDAKFKGCVNYRRVNVRGSLTFRGPSFARGGSSEEVPHEAGPREISFEEMTLANPQNIRFEGVDLSRVSFLRTDVSQVRFVGCRWPEKLEPILWPFRIKGWGPFASRRTVHDEERLEGSGSAQEDRRLVAELYRQLRLNLEATKQEVEAGGFYIGQMEMRRQDSHNSQYPWYYRLLLAVYRVLGMYGQSYWRPFVWYALILAPLFAWGYWLLGTISYGEGLFTALTAGALFDDVPDGIESWEMMLLYFNVLADLLLLGLILVAFRRHFTR